MIVRYNRIGRFVINCATRVVPVALILYLSVSNADSIKVNKWYFGLILGLCLVIWGLLWHLSDKMNSIEHKFDEFSPFNIHIIKPNQIKKVVQTLYSTPNSKFYSTHIGYTQYDVGKSDARNTDWASSIYQGGNQVPFKRIIQVSDGKDKKWIRDMVDKSKNKSYQIHIYEGKLTIPYPNMIIVKSENKDPTALMSFRSESTDGSGQFTFVTSNPSFTKRLLEHFEHFFKILPSSKEYLSRQER